MYEKLTKQYGLLNMEILEEGIIKVRTNNGTFKIGDSVWYVPHHKLKDFRENYWIYPRNISQGRFPTPIYVEPGTITSITTEYIRMNGQSCKPENILFPLDNVDYHNMVKYGLTFHDLEQGNLKEIFEEARRQYNLRQKH